MVFKLTEEGSCHAKRGVLEKGSGAGEECASHGEDDGAERHARGGHRAGSTACRVAAAARGGLSAGGGARGTSGDGGS